MASKPPSAKLPTVVPTDAELEELGKSLTTREIPAKLRCGNCDLIAYNTIRLPCCSTNICENCFKTEFPNDSDECILCHHSPLDRNICTPNKSMRTTIRALLKNKFETRLKKQAAEAAKAAKEAEQVGVAENGVSTNNDPVVNKEAAEGKQGDHFESEKGEAAAQPMEQSLSATSIKSAGSRGEDHRTVESAERRSNDPSHGQGAEAHEKGDEEPLAGSNHVGSPGTANAQQNGQWPNASSSDQGFTNGATSMNSMNNMNGMFPMGLNSMMSNSMMPMAGFPNMMGMGMMPQMMSQMLGGFDASNMGMNMNAMNMGMGFNAQNQYGNSWMTGQDSYNNNAYGNGGYGNQGGYNMSGNYNSMNDQSYASNDFHRGYGRQGYQNRGRGRGRRGYYNGGYGRDNYNQNHQGSQYGYANQNNSVQQLYPQRQNEETSNFVIGSPTREQASKEGVTAEEADAQMLEEFAPGGQHDFDEELGRKPSIDEDDKKLSENAENADTSTSSDSKETLPTEATAEGDVNGHDHVEPSIAKEEQISDEKETVNDSTPTGEHPAAVADNTNLPKEEAAENQEGDNIVADPTPQPIQTFISDEPRFRNPMPPPDTSAAVGSVPPHGAHGYNHDGHTPSNASQTTEVSSTEPKGLGVVGAPTGPRALRQSRPNAGRNVWDATEASRPSIPESNGSEARGRSRSRSPIRPPSAPYARSRSRSRSPAPRPSEHYRNKRHRSPSEYSERPRERRDDRRDEKREDRRHRHSHRRYDEDEVQASDARRSSYRSHHYHNKDLEQSDRRRHRDRTHSRSPDRDRDQERVTEREKYRYREDDRKEERRHRRRRSRSPENSVAPTPTTPYAPELTNGYEEHNSRKRRSRDYDGEDEQERYERKRSRRESSPALERANGRYPRQHGSSKPSTPITPNFPGHSPRSRRESVVTNGVPPSQVPTITKPIPTGPRADVQPRRPEKRNSGRERERERQQEREAPQEAPKGPGNKPEKDIHTLEREARDRERLQREMQRRAFGAPKRNASGNSRDLGRRVSYKYEDEDGLDARRVEREREAGRWS